MSEIIIEVLEDASKAHWDYYAKNKTQYSEGFADGFECALKIIKNLSAVPQQKEEE